MNGVGDLSGQTKMVVALDAQLKQKEQSEAENLIAEKERTEKFEVDIERYVTIDTSLLIRLHVCQVLPGFSLFISNTGFSLLIYIYI